LRKEAKIHFHCGGMLQKIAEKKPTVIPPVLFTPSFFSLLPRSFPTRAVASRLEMLLPDRARFLREARDTLLGGDSFYESCAVRPCGRRSAELEIGSIARLRVPRLQPGKNA